MNRKAALAELKENAGKYPKNKLVPIPKYEWPPLNNHDSLFAAWVCRDYMVQGYAEPNGVIRLTVTRNKLGFGDRTWADGISWDVLQWVKGECGYGDRMAVEIYPQDDRVVNACNMRHLWVLPEPLQIGWNQGHA